MDILIKKVHFLVFFLCLNFSFSKSMSQEAQAAKSYCGNIRIEEPFVSHSSKNSSFLKNMILCRSESLYLRTSLGLFKVSAIDYKNKLLTVSHRSTSVDGKSEKVELGTRISFDIDHVPNPCDECRKPYGNCGAGLRCLCHLGQCRVEVSSSPLTKPSGTMIFSLLCLIVLMDLLEGVLGKCKSRI